MREELFKEMYRKICEARLCAEMVGMAAVIDYLDLAGDEILLEARTLSAQAEEAARGEEAGEL
jgi:hypothetical protein